MKVYRLVKKAKRGNQEALLKLIMMKKDAYYRLALSYMKNEHDALKALAEMTVALYENIQWLTSHRAFNSWSKMILAKVCKKLLRQKRMYARYEGAMAIQGSITNEHEDFLAYVNEVQREAIQLKYFHDLDEQTIAEIINVPEKTVKLRISQGLQRIRIEEEMSEKRFLKEKELLESINAPNYLESRLREALNLPKDSRQMHLPQLLAVSVIIVLSVVIGFNYQTLADYGKEILGIEAKKITMVEQSKREVSFLKKYGVDLVSNARGRINGWPSIGMVDVHSKGAYARTSISVPPTENVNVAVELIYEYIDGETGEYLTITKYEFGGNDQLVIANNPDPNRYKSYRVIANHTVEKGNLTWTAVTEMLYK